jgi:hypothetical protein
MPDTASVEANFESTDYVDRLRRVFGDVPALPTTGYKKTMTLAEFKAFLELPISVLYCKRFADAIRIPCRSVAVGTGSEPDSDAKYPVHHVSKVYENVVNFYEKYMGFARDPEGRRYLVYEP